MRRFGLFWASLVISILCYSHAQAAHRVLVVHSYHAEFDWVQGINEAIQSILKPQIGYRIFYMDTKRHPSDDWKIKAAEEAKKILSEYRPDVVIAVDDNAQAFFVREFVGKSHYKFIFCGVNANPKKYNYPAVNVTGILERTYVSQVLNMLKRIVPRTETIAWVSDYSATTNVLLPRVRAIAKKNALPIEIVDYIRPKTFDQWQKTILAIQNNPDIDALLIPLYHTVKARAGNESVAAAEVMQWTFENTTKPIVGFWPFSVDDGALCAVVVDPYEHGKVAALMARQIIGGKAVSDLPIVVNRDGYVIVNLKTAAKLGIDIPFEVIQSADRIVQ